MATTVDYILKVDSKQGSRNLGEMAKQALAANKNLIALAGGAAVVGAAAVALAKTIMAVGGALIDATKATVEFAQQSADLINDINDLSNRSAIAADTIKGLQFALQASGQNASQATQLLSRLPMVLGQAEVETSRAAIGFKNLGIEIKNADGTLRPANEVFLETVASLQEIEDQTTRSKLAFDIFGRSAGPLLQALGQTEGLKEFVEFTERFGVRTGPKASDAAADFQVVAAGLDTVLKGLKSTFIETFGPTISTLLIQFGSQLAFIQSLLISLSGTITLVFTAAMNTIVRIFDGLLAIIPKLLRALIGMIPIFGKFALLVIDLAKPLAQLTGIDQQLGGVFASFSKKINQANLDARAFEQQLTKLTKGGFKGFGVGGAGAGVGAEGAGPKGVSSGGADFGGFASSLGSVVAEFDDVSIDLTSALDDLMVSIKDLPALLERTFKISIAGIITDSIIAGASGPSGFLNTLGSALSDVTGGISGMITGAIGGIANIGKKTPEEIRQEFTAFAQAFEKGLTMLPEILVKVLPQFVIALIKGFTRAIFKLPRILVVAIGEAFQNLFKQIKEFVRETFTLRGRREAKKESGEQSKVVKFLNTLLTGQQGFMGGGIMRAQGGAKFTKGSSGFAMLHQGETVLPASGRAGQAEQRMMNQASGGGGINIVINSAVVENRAIDELVRKLETRFGRFGVGKSTLFGR